MNNLGEDGKSVTLDQVGNNKIQKRCGDLAVVVMFAFHTNEKRSSIATFIVALMR